MHSVNEWFYFTNGLDKKTCNKIINSAKGKWEESGVNIKECNEWMGENITKIKNIKEDSQGRDFLTFECPECKTTQKSHRVG